jgi:hypothetical protein
MKKTNKSTDKTVFHFSIDSLKKSLNECIKRIKSERKFFEEQFEKNSSVKPRTPETDRELFYYWGQFIVKDFEVKGLAELYDNFEDKIDDVIFTLQKRGDIDLSVKTYMGANEYALNKILTMNLNNAELGGNYICNESGEPTSQQKVITLVVSQNSNNVEPWKPYKSNLGIGLELFFGNVPLNGTLEEQKEKAINAITKIQTTNFYKILDFCMLKLVKEYFSYCYSSDNENETKLFITDAWIEFKAEELFKHLNYKYSTDNYTNRINDINAIFNNIQNLSLRAYKLKPEIKEVITRKSIEDAKEKLLKSGSTDYFVSEFEPPETFYNNTNNKISWNGGINILTAWHVENATYKIKFGNTFANYLLRAYKTQYPISLMNLPGTNEISKQAFLIGKAIANYLYDQRNMKRGKNILTVENILSYSGIPTPEQLKKDKQKKSKLKRYITSVFWDSLDILEQTCGLNYIILMGLKGRKTINKELARKLKADELRQLRLKCTWSQEDNAVTEVITNN